jgi:ATP-dependent helicase/nuclease subunit A
MADKPELNTEQKAAAYCAENAVVAAGAGSGKTMVLASRYAWLITEKKLKTGEILCLTFTNKAAAQMYQRIYANLFDISIADNGVKGGRAKEAINDFVHARIQTLDSYSAALVRQCAPRYGINPDFTIDQERCYALADETALPFIISRCTHPVIQRLYPETRPQDIADTLLSPILNNFSYIERGPDVMNNTKKQFDFISAEWKKTIDTIENNLKNLDALISDDENLLPDLPAVLEKYRNGEIVFPDETYIQNYFGQLLKLPPDECIAYAEADPVQDEISGALKFMADLSGISLKKGKRSDNPVKDLIKEFFRPIFGDFSSLAVFCMQAGLMRALFAMLEELQEQYLNKKRAESILTFADVARLARTILLEQPDIRNGEKETFKAIMIDEFQDNNELQKDLLFLLAEKPELLNTGIPPAHDLSQGKLFFVGDEKQSIYLFRGADVSVFKKLKNELRCDELSLAINYRSAPCLIGAFNAIFGGSEFDPAGKAPLAAYPSVFIPEKSAAGDGAIPLYEAAYTPLQAGKTGGGAINIRVFDKSGSLVADNGVDESRRDSALPPLENEACFVAERIQQLLEQKTESGESQYKPDDIAILFRTRTSQHLFEKHLRLLNIPYTSENLSDLFIGGPVNDLMSVLRLAAYPADRAAYAEMLRSPFAGLSLSGLAICMFGESEPFSDAPLASLSESDQFKYRQGQGVYRHIRDKARYANVSSLLSELWYTLGYRYETQWNPQTAVYRELYDYLFHLAVLADAENQGLAAFTDAIQAKRDNEERITDIDIPLERSGAVQLMTIHKSKGLEFPVVFLCCCDKHGRYEQCGAVFDTDNAGIAVSPPIPEKIAGIGGIRKNYFWENYNTEAKRKRTAELRRLFYVGMTRAEKELYISGCLDLARHKQKNNEEPLNDFSLILKNYVEDKTGMPAAQYGENEPPADSIIDNDTFFGLCLPALASHIPPDGLAVTPTFFTVEEIPAYPEDYAHKRKTGSAQLPNNQTGLNTFFRNTEKFYRGAQELPLPVLVDNHFSPTSLGKNVPDKFGADKKSFTVDTEFSGEDAAELFAPVDSLLRRFAAEDESEKFNAASFGTIAHACVEKLLKAEEPEIPAALNGFLTPAESAAFLKAGRELAVRFIRSPLGKIASTAEKRENEFPFRTLLADTNGNETFISGSIDLLFEDGHTVYVVDFKTDSQENPGEHTVQMACYYRAVSELRKNKNCRVWLYYLRSGHAVEMSGQVGDYFA